MQSLLSQTALLNGVTSPALHRRECRWHATQGSTAVRAETSASSNGVSGQNGAQAAVTAPHTPQADGRGSKLSRQSKQFANTNRFWVPAEVTAEFEAAWAQREKDMKAAAGHLGFDMEKKENTYTCTSHWSSIPEWENFSLSPASRRSHLPWGVFQYVPARGEGFPEDFVPFLNMKAAVDAKY